MAKMGRPSKYSPAVVKRILELTANSANGLETICKKNPDLPGAETIRRWLIEKEDFRGLYARAKEQQADVIADEIMEIADKLARGKISNDKVNAARLRVDSRKWIAAKLKPKRYGDRTDITTGGESLNKGFADLLKSVSAK